MQNNTLIKEASIVILLLFIGTNFFAANTVLADAVTQPPIPGNMHGNNPMIDVGDITPISESHPRITEISRDVDIVNLITQINESLILGYLQNLTSFGPRVTGETGCIQAAEYLYNEFAGMGLEVRYHHWVTGGYDSNNVEATLPGIDPSSDDIYIVCGHYDTVSSSPGADDDGSGVAAVLAAAKVMSQSEFNHTIRFVAFSGEEEGIFGSYIYVQEAYNNGDDIKGVLNADMIGFALDDSQAGSLNIYEDDLSEWLYDYTYYVNQLYTEYIDLQLIHTGWTWGSDHYYFWEYGYSALFYQEYEFNHFYHSPQDIIENMNVTYMAKAVRLIIATLASLGLMDTSNSPPPQPIIQGPHYGKVDVEYSFSIGPITDPDGDNFYCLWDWGDGSQSNWLGPYTNGQSNTEKHQWSEPGTYQIRAKIKDIYGAGSDWSEPFTMYITSKMLLIGFVQNVNPGQEVTNLTMKIGIKMEFKPFDIRGYSSADILALNNETKGYIGSRFLIGPFYALVLSE